MAHRGRLNVLANIVGKSYGEIFREFEGDLDPDSVQGSGDVKYHKGATGKFVARTGSELAVTLASNPSHLEAVDPVVEGMVRAKQDMLGGDRRFDVLSVLVHGDAAFAGQGVVAETLELSQLTGYRTGGTVHVVVNNQLGFTTAPESARSSLYPTDVAKMVQAPVFHVNGDDPEACLRAARLAFGFRQAFHKDVVIDLVCYRRHGHNEGDDPSYTQPRMYAIIDGKRSVRKLYTESLVRRGDITVDEAERALEDFQARLQVALDETRADARRRSPRSLPAPPCRPRLAPGGVHRRGPRRARAPGRGGDRGARGLHRPPQAARASSSSGPRWWPTARSTGPSARPWPSGRSCSRAPTCASRARTPDAAPSASATPCSSTTRPGRSGSRSPISRGEDVGRFGVHDSLLSEYAAVGFEYGYSVESPDALVAWEAQFGDFANGAQIIIDNFFVSADDKWGQRSGLVLLLPHGYEGQGPEHSSARIERFLTLCARDNMRLAQPTTAAQYFHLLRSQVRGMGRQPLVVFTPKSLLRARQSRSPLDELTVGVVRRGARRPRHGRSDCQRGAGTPRSTPAPCAGCCCARARWPSTPWPGATRCSAAERRPPRSRRRPRRGGRGPGRAALPLARGGPGRGARPLPGRRSGGVGPGGAREHGGVVLRPRTPAPPPPRPLHLTHVSRAESASPATGSAALHQLEQEDLLRRAFS